MMDSDFNADEALRQVRERANRLAQRIERHAARLSAEHDRDCTAAAMVVGAGGVR
ncbi:hypothetical protein AB0442_38180 [Kitasatospora sp. NPDC085895]|uniref:hypothetical protein n=1 Tax=Kitasatospora sp. NPDC085895 TaxID=3155057 RepID=UPI00344FB926